MYSGYIFHFYRIEDKAGGVREYAEPLGVGSFQSITILYPLLHGKPAFTPKKVI